MENLRRELQSLSDDQFDPAELKRLEAAWESARVVSERLQGELRELDAQRNTLSHTLSRVVAELASASERMAFADREADRSETESRKAGADLAALEARMAEAGVELERVQQAEMDNQAQLGLLAREKDDVTRTADAARNERAAIKTARDAANNKLNQAQKQQKASYQERTQVETDSVTIRERLREVDRRLVEDAEFQPGDVDESTPQNMLAALGELDLADVSAEKLKIRLQSLGPVNMLALEELKAVEERYRFLTDQKKDLERGIEVLNETIDRINFDARRLFRETIEQINIHFQDTFRTLFEGGEARVTLAEGDPLEADIRIWATPSGKKLQSLSMLSGGEKALTAVALLFSIYRARPTPFCILDEVDAPLDDANVTRFNKLLRQHTRDTQFLIVTHNKRTMEAADCLYGVTLAEDGTSRIVSVTINGRQEPVPSQIGVEVENI
jgi:chromosome segregation protein